MSILSDLFSLRKLNIYINIIVIFFIYLFVKSHPRVDVRDSNFHNHCETKTRTYIDNENDDEIVDLEMTVVGHAHPQDDGSFSITKAKDIQNYSHKNIYTAGYDKMLEIYIKTFILVIVLISTFSINALLLKRKK
jgi:hypothetical protein